MDLGDDYLALLAASLSLAFCLAVWVRRTVAPQRQVRKMMGMGALLGAAALLLMD